MSHRRDVIIALFCVCLTIVCSLLCCGNVEIPFLDDGPYTKSALDFATQGHFVFNGWAAAMLGIQLVWGALWIKLFGFSFYIVRLSTVPLAAGSALALYAICRRDGLSPRLAALGCLSVMLAPVVIPHCLSFMTDIPSLFFFLWSVYALARARSPLEKLCGPDALTETESARQMRELAAWLTLASVISIAGGTIRQLTWLVPLLTLSYWALRYRLLLRPNRISGVLGFFIAINVLVPFALMNWFVHQPYAIREREDEGVRILLQRVWHDKNTLYEFLLNGILVILTVIWHSVPAILLTVPLLWRDVRGTPRRQSLINGIILVGVLLVGLRIMGKHWKMPWLRASVSNLFFNTPLLVHVSDDHFRVMPEWLRVLISLGILALTLLLAWAGLNRLWALRDYLRSNRKTLAWPALPPSTETLTLFSIVYFLGLLIKIFVPDAAYVWDRYSILLLPWTALIALGYYSRHNVGTRIGKEWLAAWITVVIGAVFGVCQGHDYYSYLKAIYAQTEALTSRGVPRHDIMGGFEYDFWTQVTEVGYVNDPRIQVPHSVYVEPPPLPFKTDYVLARFAPVVNPRFVVVAERHDTLGPDVLPPQSYGSWLTPRKPHYIYVQSVPGRSADPFTDPTGETSKTK